jgi:hypothetical protein
MNKLISILVCASRYFTLILIHANRTFSLTGECYAWREHGLELASFSDATSIRHSFFGLPTTINNPSACIFIVAKESENLPFSDPTSLVKSELKSPL